MVLYVFTIDTRGFFLLFCLLCNFVAILYVYVLIWKFIMHGQHGIHSQKNGFSAQPSADGAIKGALGKTF